MFYTNRLFLRQVDPEADTKILLKWFNDPDSAREISPPGPTMPKSRESIKKMIASLADKEDKLPFFIVCDNPDAKSMPKNLGHDDDFFIDNGEVTTLLYRSFVELACRTVADSDIGRPRYPAIGLLNIGYSRGHSPMNRTVMLGVVLDEQHQGLSVCPFPHLPFAVVICSSLDSLKEGSALRTDGPQSHR